MRAFLALLLASSCVAAATVFAGDDISSGELISIEEGMLVRKACPRGWEKVPQYRWNQRTHRWEFSGWTCRRVQISKR